MIVSTLILIARIQLLEIFLTGVSVPIVIPGEVESESCGKKKTLDALWIRKMLEESKIRVIQAKNPKFVLKLRVDFNLGRGEAEALGIAIAENAQLVAIDDKNGINACKLLGLAFTTAVGILLRSREKELISHSDALFKLDLLASYGRYKSSMVEDTRSRLEVMK